MRSKIRWSGIVGLCIGLAGCNVLVPTGCTLEALPYLVVEVRDARTGAPAAMGATGMVQEGSFIDTLYAINELVLETFEYERAGTYNVRIQKAGYQDWTAQDVRVKKGRCGVETVTLRARLEPAS
jgi:hypothetical protein